MTRNNLTFFILFFFPRFIKKFDFSKFHYFWNSKYMKNFPTYLINIFELLLIFIRTSALYGDYVFKIL